MRLLWLSAFVVVVDQVTKAMVLRHMYRGESIPLLGDWLKLTFTENPGMAFGIEVGPAGTITWLSIIAVVLVVYYIFQVRQAPLIYRAGLAFILGGAIGNIIDRVFYGAWLGYGELFQGKVVDFIHVSVWEGRLPDLIPFIGGGYMELFPIWNVADMAIVCGVVGVLALHQQFHEQMLQEERERAERERRAQEGGASTDAQVAAHENGHPAPNTNADAPEKATPAPDAATADDTPVRTEAATPDDPRADAAGAGDGSAGEEPLGSDSVAEERPSKPSS